jgi:hypothetical protein
MYGEETREGEFSIFLMTDIKRFFGILKIAPCRFKIVFLTLRN